MGTNEIHEPTETPAPGRTRRRAVIAAAATLAVLGVGVGGYAVHSVGVTQGREQVSAAAPTPVVSAPQVTGTDTMCGGRYVISVGGKRYLLVASGFGKRDMKLIDVDVNHRDEPCASGSADEAHSAQRFVGWDRDTQGCVWTTMIDARQWIISDGWGLIPADGRIADTPGYGDAESERDGGKCSRQIDFASMPKDLKPGDSVPMLPSPPVVPPIEDTAGYAIDSRVKCSSQDSRWERYRYVPTLGTCVPFSTDGSGFKIRADAG